MEWLTLILRCSVVITMAASPAALGGALDTPLASEQLSSRKVVICIA